MAPLAILLAMLLFYRLGGEIVLRLWNIGCCRSFSAGARLPFWQTLDCWRYAASSVRRTLAFAASWFQYASQCSARMAELWSKCAGKHEKARQSVGTLSDSSRLMSSHTWNASSLACHQWKEQAGWPP